MSHFSVAVFTKNGTMEEVEKLLEPYQEADGKDSMDRKYLEFEEDEDGSYDEEVGKTGWWQNPNAKWDWYRIGGRWISMLIPKKNTKSVGVVGDAGMFSSAKLGRFDSMLVSDIDFEAMRQEAMKDLTPYDKLMEESYYLKEYLKKKYPNEEAYILDSTTFSTYAAVTPDGVWHSKGTMGWFGFGSDTVESSNEFRDSYREKFIEPAIKNGWYMTIVDCHI